MVKKTKKKGFTFVEVLITIVIIAVMVSVLIPVVEYSTLRAKAAANAANLRSAEAKLQNMRLQYPDDFNTQLTEARGIYEYLKETYEFVADVLYGKGAGEVLLTAEYGTFTATNEYITLPVSGVQVDDMAKSKGINLPGSNLSNGVILAEHTPMTIYITEDNITAAYSYYTADVFADIAEDGKFDGEVKNPNATPEGGITEFICQIFDHQFDASGICKICKLNRNWHDCIDEYKDAFLGLGEAKPGKDYKCDICDATMGHECVYNRMGVCELCGAGQHDCYDNNKDHYCDKKGVFLVSEDCGRRLTECDEKEWDNPTGHYCSYCGGLTSYHDNEFGKCRTCGRAAHVVPADCVDTPGDGKHTCSYQGCNQDVFKNHFDNNDNHECDDCRVELTDKHVDNKGTSYKDGWFTRERGDHNCDVCGKNMSDCADGNNDGHCDVCNALVEHPHSDGNDKNHTCDVEGCEEKVSDCDANGGFDKNNHKCSQCGQSSSHSYIEGKCICGRSQHHAPTDCSDVTTDGDHNCDTCGYANITKCEVKDLGNGMHGCNCGANTASHSFQNSSSSRHECSGCGLRGSHQAETNSHYCVCGRKMSNCDVQKIDANTHGCKVCGAGTGNHVWTEDGSNRHKCSCGATESHSSPCDKCGYSGSSGGSGGSGSCVTPDTLITLADGTKKRVDQLDGSELLLVWNMETGMLDAAPIMFVDSEAETEVEVIYLHFSDGTIVKVITEHGFWDYDLNKYVYLDRNADDYIGHSFFRQSGNSGAKVKLLNVEIKTELTTAWSPVTAGHLNYFVNGMLSMPGGVGGLFNIFDVNPETMTYDYEAMARDIETYGLLTYEELASVMPLSEDMFNAAGGAYLNISIGKGNMTEEELFAMIERYSVYFQ